jgi:hypothetical protein
MGCSPRQVYPGEKLPPSEVSFLDIGRGGPGISPGSVTIDNRAQSFYHFHSGFELLPGKHVISVDYSAAWESCSTGMPDCRELYSNGECTVVIDMKQGARYKVDLRAKIRSGQGSRGALPYDRQIVITSYSLSSDIDDSQASTGECQEINITNYEPLFH